MKVKKHDAFDVGSIIEYANDVGRAYIEIDVPAIRGTMGAQSALIRNGFFPIAYMPAMNYHEGERNDIVRFGYLTDKSQAKDIVLNLEEITEISLKL